MEVFPPEDPAPGEVVGGPSVSQLEQMKAWDDSFTQLEKALQAACETKDVRPNLNNWSKPSSSTSISSPPLVAGDDTAAEKQDLKRKCEDDEKDDADNNSRPKHKRTSEMTLSSDQYITDHTVPVSNCCDSVQDAVCNPVSEVAHLDEDKYVEDTKLDVPVTDSRDSDKVNDFKDTKTVVQNDNAFLDSKEDIKFMDNKDLNFADNKEGLNFIDSKENLNSEDNKDQKFAENKKDLSFMDTEKEEAFQEDQKDSSVDIEKDKTFGDSKMVEAFVDVKTNDALKDDNFGEALEDNESKFLEDNKDLSCVNIKVDTSEDVKDNSFVCDGEAVGDTKEATAFVDSKDDAFKEREEKTCTDNTENESIDGENVEDSKEDKKGKEDKKKEKKEESADSSSKSSKKDDKAAKKKKFERCNIRDIKLEEDLDAVTLAAQKEEQERIRRIQEAQMRALQERLQQIEDEKEVLTQLFSQPPPEASHLFGSTPEGAAETTEDGDTKPVLPLIRNENEVILLESSDEEKKTELQGIIPQTTPENIIDISSSSSDSESESEDDELDKKDDDIMVLSDEGESEEPEDPNNSGAHTNDCFNLPDHEGRVLVNVGHPPEDPDIFLAPQVSKVLKPHQIGGIRFLYDNVVENLERYKTSSGFGCILAHSMGLGKTVQVVSFVDVFLRHTPATLVLCIVPINTIQNWKAEFDMWVPSKTAVDETQVDNGEVRPRDYNVYTLNENFKTMAARAALIAEWQKQGGVLLMGYEMYRMLALRKMPKIPVKKNTTSKKARKSC